MTKNYRYLKTRLSDLLWRYGLFYVTAIIILIFSYKPILTFSIWYWLICGTLFFLEYKGSFFIIKDSKLMQIGAFRHGRDIPLDKVLRLSVGNSKVVVLQPQGLSISFENNTGVKENFVTVFFTLDPNEVAKFVTDITKAEPRIIIDEKLRVWIQKNVPQKT